MSNKSQRYHEVHMYIDAQSGFVSYNLDCH